jgi:hypothetical protein
MSEIDEKEIALRFAAISEFELSPEVAARDLDRVRQSLTGQMSERLPREHMIWRMIMKSRITKFAAAAAMIMAVLIGLHQLGGSIDGANVTWGDVLEQIGTFRPYTCTVVIQDEGARAQTKSVAYFSLARRRETHSNGTIVIFDLAIPKTLLLSPDKKHAIEKMLEGEPTTNFDLLHYVRAMQENPKEELDVKVIEQRKAKGFRSATEYNDITVWVDIETKLPVHVEVIHVRTGRRISNSQFEFDVDMDESLFSTTAPEGYAVEKVGKGKVTELTKFARSTTEEDLVEGLRAVAIFLDGEFPPDIELRKLQAALREYIKQNNLSESEIKERLTPVSEKWTKAHWYINQLRGYLRARDFHYSGGGVKLGDADKPVIWWQPEDSETYRVIYGDLSVRDVEPESLPK